MTHIWLHDWLRNLRQIAKDPIAVRSGILACAAVVYIGYTFGDGMTVMGNFWKEYYYLQLGVHYILAVVFWIFISATVYKIRYFRSATWATTTTAWGAGGIIWTILIGCPACSLSIASYLGLWTLLTHLPGFGIEIKILALMVLLWATYKTVNDLYICNISHRNFSTHKIDKQ